MSDWLKELEKRKRLERQQADRQKAEATRQFNEEQSRQRKAYRKHKRVIDKTFDAIISYATRANAVADRQIAWKRYDVCLELTNGSQREAEDPTQRMTQTNRYFGIKFNDDVFEIGCTRPLQHGDDVSNPYGKIENFRIAVGSVTDEHISSWNRWLVTNEVELKR